jgi:hypothetical protein
MQKEKSKTAGKFEKRQKSLYTTPIAPERRAIPFSVRWPLKKTGIRVPPRRFWGMDFPLPVYSTPCRQNGRRFGRES